MPTEIEEYVIAEMASVGQRGFDSGISLAVSICDSVLAGLLEQYPLEHPACAAVDLVRARIREGK